MKFRTIIFLRNREALIKNINRKSTHLMYHDGLYVISPENVNNYEEKDKIKGSEILFFEGNPNPIGIKKQEDNSAKYLDEILLINALSQTSESPKFHVSSIIDVIDWFKNPANLMWLFFIGVIAYGLIWGALHGGI